MLRCIFAAAGALLVSLGAHAQLRIVTTTTDFADIARQIGRDKVEVHSVMKGPENVHNVLAKPTEMLHLNKADLFVHGGLDSEPWRDNLLKGARNPKVLFGKPGYVDMSAGIELKEVPTVKVDRSMGDIHAYGNPHFQLDPAAVQRMTVTLVRAMCAADPANAAFYKDNARKFVTDMAEVEQQLKAELEPYSGLKIITYHAAWLYFADAFDLDVVTTIEAKPGITPSPGQITEVVRTMKRQGVRIVVVETYDSFDQAEAVADAAGARVIRLPDHVLGVPEADSYQDLFRYNVHKLIEAAKAAGIEPRPVTSATTTPAATTDSEDTRDGAD